MPTNKSLVSRLRSVSLDASGGEAGKGDNHLSSHSRPVPTISQYHQNYQPMAKGLRHSVWEEGYKQRCERKQNGFNHFKLEWIVPTDRSVGRRSMQPEVGLRKKYYSARIARPSHHGGNYGEQRGSIHDLIEPLILPPTKVEEKRQKLHKMYERREKKRIEARLLEAKRSEADMGNVDGAPKFSTDYEKNKFNNGESHINLPTCSSYTTSTSRSLPPSATKRGTNND